MAEVEEEGQNLSQTGAVHRWEPKPLRPGNHRQRKLSPLSGETCQALGSRGCTEPQTTRTWLPGGSAVVLVVFVTTNHYRSGDRFAERSPDDGLPS